MNHPTDANTPSPQSQDHPTKPKLNHIILSTLCAAFGVQSRRNQERDFKHGNIFVFITAGILFTSIFIGAVYWLVHFVLSLHGVNQ
ncbi:DUF2970 domain-containing protein [Marinibactrum halimedae]|uniref:DUF2970 domain-containing protein n=1 Tax=Marinibactrum halimedae TaxID=1444977 RepID=UPI001E41F274|nr:DUF2970 domain-containing protein [Marinibactrum halimedae]MCD9460586.1 DUF2970 domain-containing protein [Marinibactrum halimedae]